MLDATHKKLREAQFFLSHLTKVEGRISRPEPEAPSFYLSAFLSAARSVGDAIDTEEGQPYRDWFTRRKALLTADQAELLKFTNSQRIQAVHVRGPDVQTNTRLVPIYELQRELEERGGLLEVHPGGVPGAPLPMPQAERTTLAFRDYPGKGVLAICERYLALLTRLVNEYEASVRGNAA
jgi:hypothetical protein